MTSAQNHQLLLNGNKLGCLLLIVLIGISCDPLKKTAGSNPASNSNSKSSNKIRYNSNTGKYDVNTQVTEPVDTISWTLVENDNPITSPEEEVIDDSDMSIASEKKPYYNVCLMLPAETNKIQTVADLDRSKKAQRAVQFYGGVKMALNKLDSEGVNANVTIVDVGYDPSSALRTLNSMQAEGIDLIIGPTYGKNSLMSVCGFSKSNNVTFVSPIYPSNKICEQNPMHIQVGASLLSHTQNIIHHAKRNYPNANYNIIGRITKKSRTRYFDKNKFEADGQKVDTLRTILVEPKDPDFVNYDFKPYLNPVKTNVFIVPAYSGSDQKYVLNVLRLLNLAIEENHKIVVYGMPIWKNFSQLNYEHLEKLNVHLTSDIYIDEDAWNVQSFKKNFFGKYRIMPEDDAYKGYDMTLFFLRMMHKYGNKFQFMLDKDESQYMHTKFDFEPIVSEENRKKEDFSKVERYENKHLNMITLKDYKFISAQ